MLQNFSKISSFDFDSSCYEYSLDLGSEKISCGPPHTAPFLDCTLPSVDKISLLNGSVLKHGRYISNLACDQSSTPGSPNLLIGGSQVTCNDGTLQYTGVSTYEPRCLGNMAWIAHCIFLNQLH